MRKPLRNKTDTVNEQKSERKSFEEKERCQGREGEGIRLNGEDGRSGFSVKMDVHD